MSRHNPIGPFENALNRARPDIDFIERHIAALKNGLLSVLDRIASDNDPSAIRGLQLDPIAPGRMPWRRKKIDPAIELPFPRHKLDRRLRQLLADPPGQQQIPRMRMRRVFPFALADHEARMREQ